MINLLAWKRRNLTIQSQIRLFADDTSLFFVVEHVNTTAEIMNFDISKLTDWASKWLVSFNPSKTESLLITRKTKKPVHPQLVMQNQSISEVQHHKHLGVFLSSDCSWHSHLDSIKEKAWKRINIMRKLKHQLDRKSLEIIYLSFIRPILEYADVVWSNCTEGDKMELDKVQNEAARITTGATKLVSLQNLQRETGWPSLESRRREHKLILFYKMVNNLTPPYLSSLVPSIVGASSRYALRDSHNLSMIHSRTQLYYHSFLPSAIREWNSLPFEIRSKSSVSSFKQCIRDATIPTPKHYFVGNRREQILHTRLRTNCSSLNQHLFEKNIVESPMCRCGEVEDTRHFFFSCPYYNAIRNTLLLTVSQFCTPSTDTLLHGNLCLPFELNKAIFTSVQQFIVLSKRFD